MTSLSRDTLLSSLREPGTWDLIVIGGGATGLGTAVDAAARGYRTLLLEGADFAKGTSSRSTKLVHGGVRYLAQGNIHLVKEALRERGLLRKNAPHLVHKTGFIIPAYSYFSIAFYGAGLKIYDLLAGKLGFGATRFLNARETLERAPNLRTKALRGGILYWDGQFDDARLAITLLRTFFDQGGTALNYLPMVGLLKQEGHVSGVIARDLETGEEFTLKAKAVINATGVFVDAIRRMDEPDVAPMLSPSQGIHLVVERRFQPGNCAVMIPKTDDGRVLFALPWHDKIVIGTTDTPVARVSIEPRALEEEIAFVLRTAAQYFAQPPGRGDVLSIYAGQRPLVKLDASLKSAAISREHTICTSRAGLITITGGKWTTYRKMGEEAVDRAITSGFLSTRPACTAELRLHGAPEQNAATDQSVYGTDLKEIQTLPGADRPLHPALTVTEAEVRWAARYELARCVEDVLARRSRSLLLDAKSSIAAAPRAAEILASELGRDAQWIQDQIASYTQLASGYLLG